MARRSPDLTIPRPTIGHRWVLSITVACLAVACGGTAVPTAGSQGPTAIVAASSGPSPATSTTASAASRPTIAPFKSETSVEFKPTLTLRNVPSTWSLHEDTPGTFILETDTQVTAADGSPSAIYVLNHGMVDPPGCAEPVDRHEDAKQMTATLVALPGLIASKPKGITLAGRPGFLTEIHVNPTWTTACHGTGNGVELLHSLPPTSDPTFDDGIGIGTFTALYLLDRPEGGVMTIQVDDQSGGHDLAAYESVVETLQLQP
jgi:hypothetical protein